MEILGSTFDDSVFSEARDRVCESLTAYNAKVCEPEKYKMMVSEGQMWQCYLLYSKAWTTDSTSGVSILQWFCESSALDTEDSLEKQKVYKFRGDLALRQGNYQRALEAYSSCLQWIADNNLSIRRDVLEGMARCCTKLGQRHKALGLVDLLSKEASNTCHLTSLLLLKVNIYQHFQAVGSQMSCLQQLCSLLPFNPWHWFSLGQMCLQLLDSNTATAADGADGEIEEQQEEAEELSEDWLWLKASVCFIRTRLLLRILRQQQSSFVLQRTEKVLQKTEEALQRLNPKEITLQALTEVMSDDLIPEKMREDFQDGESLASMCLQSFRERWWNRILLIGLLQADRVPSA